MKLVLFRHNSENPIDMEFGKIWPIGGEEEIHQFYSHMTPIHQNEAVYHFIDARDSSTVYLAMFDDVNMPVVHEDLTTFLKLTHKALYGICNTGIQVKEINIFHCDSYEDALGLFLETIEGKTDLLRDSFTPWRHLNQVKAYANSDVELFPEKEKYISEIKSHFA